MESLKEQGQGRQTDNSAITSIEFLHGQLALDAFRQASRNPLYVTVLREILAHFFSVEVGNFRIFTTADGAVSFPYTFIDVTRLAGELYTRFASGHETSSHLESAPAPIPIIRSGDRASPKRSIYVLFGFAAFSVSGHPFTGVEIAMHQTIRALRTVIRALRTDSVPPEVLVITLGSPTNNRWGKITPACLDELAQGNPFAILGKSYRELLLTFFPQRHEEKANTSLILNGISMGACATVATADLLLRAGEVTQDTDRLRKEALGVPLLQVLLDVPVAFNVSGVRWGQIRIGFCMNILAELVISPKASRTILGENEFLKGVETVLAHRGIGPIKDPDQRALRGRALHLLMKQLSAGMPLPEYLHVIIRRGMYDATMYSPAWYRAAKAKIASYKKQGKRVPLGSHLMPNLASNIREYAIRGDHAFPFFRKKEMQCWRRSVEALLNLGLSGQVGT